MKWTEEAVYAPAFADLAETKSAETEKVLYHLSIYFDSRLVSQ